MIKKYMPKFSSAWNHVDDIVKLYEKVSALVLAEKFGTSNQTIYNILKSKNIARRPGKMKLDAWDSAIEIRALYLGGSTLVKIADDFAVDRGTIASILKSLNVNINRSGPPKHGAWNYANKLIESYGDGNSLKAVANKFDVSIGTTRKILLHHGVEMRPRNYRSDFGMIKRKSGGRMTSQSDSRADSANTYASRATGNDPVE